MATVFQSLPFLTGVFGMNVAGLPDVEQPNAFNLLAGGMGLIALALIAFVWWKRWF